MKRGTILNLTNQKKFLVAYILEHKSKQYGLCVELDSKNPSIMICECDIENYKKQNYLAIIKDEKMISEILSSQQEMFSDYVKYVIEEKK